MRKYIKALFLFILIVTILVGCKTKDIATSTENNQDQNQVDKWDEVMKTASDYVTVAENNQFVLMIHPKTTALKVMDKRNQSTWLSNPEDVESGDIYANSQVIVNYYSATLKSANMNSFSDAVAYSQFTFDDAENGIVINYRMGKEPDIILAPSLIEANRYEELFNSMSKEDQKVLKSRYKLLSLEGISEKKATQLKEKYPILAEHNVYSADGLADFVMKKLEEIFVKYGYTEEDLVLDNEENLLEAPEVPLQIGISVKYTLESDGLKACILNDSISLSKKAYLSSINLLPYLGAGDSEDEGYIMIPDGSGALIEFNNGKTGYDAYEGRVYGEDNIFTEIYKKSVTQNVYMPVFGIKKNENAFLAIIQEGAADASITASPIGKNANYNNVSTKFIYTASNKTNVDFSGQSLELFSENSNSTDYGIKYIFLEKEDADYSGMAREYRHYLQEEGQLTDKKVTSYKMGCTLLGAVDYSTTVLGFPKIGNKVLTDFEQSRQILENLLQNGVKVGGVRYLYMMNDGTRTGLYDTVDVLKELGGKKGLKKLSDYAKENSIDLYPDANFLYVGKNDRFDSFIAHTWASRGVSNDYGYKFRYSPHSNRRMFYTKEYIISPKKMDTLINEFLSSYNKLGVGGLAVSSMGTDINSDYNKKDTYYRSNTLEEMKQQFEKLNQTEYKIATEGANDYSVSYVDAIFNVPTQSSRYYLEDTEIPFYQIVMHGYVELYSKPMNLEESYQTMLLKIIETGSMPAYQFIANDNSVMKDTDYSFFSSKYTVWEEQVIVSFDELQSCLESVSDKLIQSHEIVKEGVNRTIYEDGTRIYVNYTEKDCETRDGIVPSGGYLIKGGE